LLVSGKQQRSTKLESRYVIIKVRLAKRFETDELKNICDNMQALESPKRESLPPEVRRIIEFRHGNDYFSNSGRN
jgi:hypothetical protein